MQISKTQNMTRNYCLSPIKTFNNNWVSEHIKYLTEDFLRFFITNFVANDYLYCVPELGVFVV